MEMTKKAYWVGTKEHLQELHMPWCEAELILADPALPESKVKRMMIFGWEYDYLDLRTRRAPSLDLYNYEGYPRPLTKSDIFDIEETIKWRRETAELVYTNPDAKVYIYSGEYDAWWRDGGAGYTDKKELAGIYEINDAWNRVHHVDHKKRIKLQLINQ